jgi:hypothetical protein
MVTRMVGAIGRRQMSALDLARWRRDRDGRLVGPVIGEVASVERHIAIRQVVLRLDPLPASLSVPVGRRTVGPLMRRSQPCSG